MKLYLTSTFPLFIALASSFLALSPQPAQSDEPHAGHRGMSGDFRDVIHSLFSQHELVDRTVERTDDGYVAKTTSTDPDVASMLQTHVTQMQERLDSGKGVRHWDPAFAEMRTHYEDMVVEIKNTDGGVTVSVKGTTPEAIKVAHNHANIVSGFVNEGKARMHAEHAPVVSGEQPSDQKEPCACKETKEKSCSQCEDGCGEKKKPCCADRRESNE